MATTKTTGELPAGYVSPLKLVQQKERGDCALACVATLAGKTLEEVEKLAIQHGYPEHGPAWVDETLIAKLLYQYGMVSSGWKDVAAAAALPFLAILWVDVDPKHLLGRHVIWHYVRSTPTEQPFSYIIDPAYWIDPKHQVTTNFAHLMMRPPLYYLEVTPRPDNSKKAK